MPTTLTPQLKRALADRIRYYNELGIYDFYRRPESTTPKTLVPITTVPETFQSESGVHDPVTALRLIREDMGDCTRCKLHKQGRKQIVFGVGNPRADLMFVGEGPGADEDTQG